MLSILADAILPYSASMLRKEQIGSVLYLTLDRPDVRNAINDELIAALLKEFKQLPEYIRAVVIQGEGKAFCAGGDLEWMRRASGYTIDQNAADAEVLADLFEAIATCAAFVIALVQGAAFGGGCGLVAAADFAIAQEGTKFSFSEVKLGLVPATISRYVIPKIGAGHARALFGSGWIFESDHALRIGLVHRVVQPEDRETALKEILTHVLASGPKAVTTSKRLALEEPIGNRESAMLLATQRAGDEAKEGVAAFLEKRPAAFV